jgi:uncharacterized protein (TIGR00255 family)
MIRSMTAFTRCSVEKGWGNATWELRSVNHRYLELDIRLPETLRELEIPLREVALKQLQRGKVECHLRYHSNENLLDVNLNHSLLQQLAALSEEVQSIWQRPIETSLIQILHWPGVLKKIETQPIVLHQDILELFNAGLQDLIAMRLREGESLQLRIRERLRQMLQGLEQIKQRLPLILQQQREKISMRIQELQLSIDPLRLEEEMLLLMQKMDIAEEIDRLEIHINEVQQALITHGPIGRRLDFLMQELHREANTLGSKSSDTEVSHLAIHLKVLIEQMREQAQNIE